MKINSRHLANLKSQITRAGGEYKDLNLKCSNADAFVLLQERLRGVLASSALAIIPEVEENSLGTSVEERSPVPEHSDASSPSDSEDGSDGSGDELVGSIDLSLSKSN